MADAEHELETERDPPAEFSGRMFLIEGIYVFVEAEVLTKLTELSDFFRAMLTVDIGVIEIREVVKQDFEAFVNVIRFYELLNLTNDNKIETDQEDYTRLQELAASLNEKHTISVILLCDTFSAPTVIDMTILVFQHLFNFNLLDLEEVDLIQLLELAFKLKHDVLKEFSANLMRTVSLTLGPILKRDRIAEYYTDHSFKKNTFFYYNSFRINNLDIEIRKYICEQYPSVKNIIKLN